MRHAGQATWLEIGANIEPERLFGLGCGLVDAALLASTMMTPGARIWTWDRRLAALARRLDVAWVPISGSSGAGQPNTKTRWTA